MQTQEVTYHVKLIAKKSDNLGYINYVFEDLEFKDYDYKYLMCVRFPNWEGNFVNINDIGYVTIKYVREGIDKWFDGNEMITYKYTNIIFLNFIPEKEKVELNLIKVD